MKLTQKQITEIKKKLNLKERDELLKENIDDIKKVYDILLNNLENLLDTFNKEINGFSSKNLKNRNLKKLEKEIITLFSTFSQNDLLTGYQKSLLKEYKRAFDIQKKLLEKDNLNPKKDEDIANDIANKQDKWGMTLKQRLNKTHIQLGYKTLENVQKNVKLEKDYDTVKQLALLVVLNHIEKNAVSSIVTQHTITETNANLDVLKKVSKKAAEKIEKRMVELTEEDKKKTKAVQSDLSSEILMVWIAIVDAVTCDICLFLNGTVLGTDDIEALFGYPPIHPRCRCMLSYFTANTLKGVVSMID